MKSTLLFLNNKAVKNIIVFLLVFFLTFYSNAQNELIEILPLGNSITAGYNRTTGDVTNESYRLELKNMLGDGYRFVGSQTHFVSQHEGHPGWTANNIVNGRNEGEGKLSDWIVEYELFDYVLLHIGTNDLNGMIYWDTGGSIDNTRDKIDQIIDTLKSKNPNVVIFLAKIIPDRYIRESYAEKNDELKDSLTALNDALDELATRRIASGDRIVLVDHYTAFLNENELMNTDLFQDDIVHPNVAGEIVMANTWYNAIRSFEFEGILSGARAMYFNDSYFGSEPTTLIHPVIIRNENQINFTADEWPNNTPDIRIGALEDNVDDNFSARYEGTIVVDATETGYYKFKVTGASGDKFRFWLDGNKVIDTWNGNSVNPSANYIDLAKGNTPFRLEYKHSGKNNATLSLQWEKDNNNSDSWTVVPARNIGPPSKILGWGLQGSYYANENISGTPIVREDQQINFNWDTYNPDSRMTNTDGKYAVVWEGKVQPLYSEDYFFYLPQINSNEGTLVFEFNGSTQGQPDSYQIGSVVYNRYTISGLTEGEKYNIKITYTKTDGSISSDIVLYWESVNQDLQIVPPYCLYKPDKPKSITTTPHVNGLVATYYNIKSNAVTYNSDWEASLISNNDLDLDKLEKVFIDTVDNINFNWWAGSPDYRIGADYFVCKWEGKIKLPTEVAAGDKTFRWRPDNGGLLQIYELDCGSNGTCVTAANGESLVIDSWTNDEESKSINMKTNTYYSFKALQYERGGWANTGAVLEWKPEFYLKNATEDDTFEVVPPEAFPIITSADNAVYELLVFGEDRSNSVSILNSLQYQVTYTNNVQDLGTMDLSAFDQIWYVDYKKVPDSQGKKNLQDYMLIGGKVFFVGENFENSNSAYPLWRDSLFNALGGGDVKQSQSINPTKIGFYYTNPNHVLSYSPFNVDSIQHLTTGNGTFENIGKGTIIAGTEDGGQGHPVAVAFDYGELSFAPNSRAVVYMNSNNGENWDRYVANIAEYLKQPIPETVLAVQDGYGSPGSTGKVGINLENTQQIAGVQFILRDIPNFLSVKEVKTTSRSAGFETGFNEDGTGTPIIIIYNTSGKVISQGEGPIAEITYEVSSNAPFGSSSELQLSDVILSDPNGASVPVDLVNGVFYFLSVKGDVNGDGNVNITDIVRTIFIILKKLEPTEIEMYAADCNSDEHIDILDAVCIVNLIYNNPQQQPGLLVKSQSGNTIELETEKLLSGQDNKTLVQANLTDEIAGLQLRISYDPKNLTLGEPAATGRTSGMTLSTQVKDGELIVLMYSLNGSVVKPGDGPILSIPSSVKPDTQGTTGLQLKEVILVGTDAREIPVSIITGIDDLNESMPNDYSLYQNYPNPFSSETVIKYGLPHSADVNIKVYNSLGQVIRKLVSDYREAGVYSVTWNGKDSHDLSVSPGIYIYEFNADGNFIGKKKMVVLK